MDKKTDAQAAWYRAPTYDGNLTETEKREFDRFRSQERHPAATYDDLPAEVQMYISGLQIELHDERHSNVFRSTVFVNVLGAALVATAWHDRDTTGGALLILLGALMLALSWFRCAKRYNEIQAAARPMQTNEAIRREWELDYMAMSRRGPSDQF